MTTTSPARPAWTATAGRVAVPFTLAALCGRVIGKPARKSAPTAGRAAAPAPPAARRAPLNDAARAAAHRAGFDAGRAAERLRLAAILTSPAARWHPDTARSLKFETAIPAARAVELLRALPAPALHPGARRGQGIAVVMPAQAVAARWDHVMRAAGKT